MRKPFIIANWKMHKNIEESVAFINQIKDYLPRAVDEEVGIAAQAIALSSMNQMVQGANLKIIAQNAASELTGPYTGEISARSLADAGVSYVMLGHLERRRLFHEDNQTINQKVCAAIKTGVTPIICTDDKMVQAPVKGKIHYVFDQLKGVLKGVNPKDVQKVVLSYEPSWAVGSKQSANPLVAQEGCSRIRQTIENLYGKVLANNIRILYGGSVNPENIATIMAQPDVDGVLIGRASLSAPDFLKMVNWQQALSKVM